jgi:hypothetical protein
MAFAIPVQYNGVIGMTHPAQAGCSDIYLRDLYCIQLRCYGGLHVNTEF